MSVTQTTRLGSPLLPTSSSPIPANGPTYLCTLWTRGGQQPSTLNTLALATGEDKCMGPLCVSGPALPGKGDPRA